MLREPNWLLHQDKHPICANGRPRSGTLDTPRDIARLVPYTEAVAAFANGSYSGLGFAITPGFQFIDLDKVVDDGVVQPWAQAIIDAARKLGAFVEESISGNGIHVLGHGGADFPTSRGAHVETYGHGRFMALGRRVICTGKKKLPDLTPLLGLLAVQQKPVRPKPALRLVGKAPPRWLVERYKVKELLAELNPDMDYEDWRNVGMAIHDASGGAVEGLQMWDQWSSEGEKYKQNECAAKWAGFKPGGGITMGTLVHMAQADDKPISSPVIVSGRRKELSDDELVETVHVPVPWPVEGLVPPGLTLLAAPPKMGKSYFVLQMALCVGAGKPFLGRETSPMRVSYFDLEEWEELLQKRRKRIGLAHHIGKANVHYVMELSGGDVEVMDDIQRHIDGGSKLIIIDLLARVRDELGEDAKKNAYARDYAVLRGFADFVVQGNPDVAIVMVHHTNKGQHDDWQNRISGSQGLAGATHANMLMTHVDLRGLDDDARKEALKYRRLHVTGKAVEPDEMMLTMLDDGGGWGISDKTTDEVKMQGKHAHCLQVLREADGAWVTAKEVHAQVEGTLDSVKKMLMRMAKKGEIESSGSGGAGYRVFK